MTTNIQPIRREVLESPLPQGSSERIPYKIDTTPWGGSPTSVVVTVLDNSNNDADVTGSTTTGTSSVSGNVITTPSIYQLTAGKEYTVYVKFSSGSNIFEPYFKLVCAR